MTRPLIEVNNLTKYFPTMSQHFWSRHQELVRAVEGVSFSIQKGETFSLVGESGCGKSTTARLILRLLTPTSGDVLFEGKNLTNLADEDLRLARRDMQMVFQDPYASLNPRMTLKEIISEPMVIYNVASRAEREKRVGDLLETVGLSSYHAKRYPHEFSGGQRQRIGIARALALNPKLVIGDEPVSALDVSIQSQVLNLLKDLQDEFNLTYLFIAHDLSVVEYISDRVGVMYLGSIVELGSKGDLFTKPLHPYTQALLSAVPIPDPTIRRKRIILEGDIPSPANPPSGCKFNTRCPSRMDVCLQSVPEFREIELGHYVACHLCSLK